jgi:hypothetical protein
MVRRVLDLSLGFWLLASAFLWPHGAAHFVDAVAVGGLLVIVALVRSPRQEQARHASTALAIWLFVANIVLPGTTLPTAWNHALVAVLVFLISLVPARHRAGRRTPVASVL